MQHRKKTKTSKKYSAAQVERFKVISTATAEYNAECKARSEQREWEAFLEWKARHKDVVIQAPAAPASAPFLNLQPITALIPPAGRAVPAPALPTLNFTPEDIAAIWKVAREHREVAA